MNKTTAIRSIDLLLSSPGKEKILRIYGGEPLLHFRLIRQIVPYAVQKAKKNKKNLIITPCTNATLLTKEHVGFFKKYSLRLAVSIDGNKKTHDTFRRDNNQNGSFSRIRNNIVYLFREIKKQHIAAALNTTPTTAPFLFKSFQNVLRLGFNTVNIEPIYGFQTWTTDLQRKFLKNLKEIINFILKKAYNGDFIFLTTINRELKYRELTNFIDGVCHFSESLEIGPDGEMGFSSFFLNSSEKKKYIIGNIHRDVNSRYRRCVFSKIAKICLACRSSYFDKPDLSRANMIVKIRNLISIDTARTIQKLALSSPRFADYIAAAKKHICF